MVVAVMLLEPLSKTPAKENSHMKQESASVVSVAKLS